METFRQALTDFPLEKAVVLPLHFSNDIPDTCHPVCKESKHGHEQGEDNCAVLRITVQFLQEAQKTQQPDSLQEMHKGHLQWGRRAMAGHSVSCNPRPRREVSEWRTMLVSPCGPTESVSAPQIPYQKAKG